MTIQVVMADDSYIVREGVGRLLSSVDDVEVVASCENYDSLLEAVDKHVPDVVLTDIRMPPTNTDEGIRAAEHLREIAPDTGVVVLSQYDDADYALALFEGGSERRAYLLKERVSDLEQIVGAIREVAGGGSVVDSKIVESLVAARSRAAKSPLAALTPREKEILGEMAQGKTNASIAASLVLTERAVEKHINSIFSKLMLSGDKKTHRRVKAVLMFLAEQG